MATAVTKPSAAMDAWVGLLRAHAGITRKLNAELLAAHGLTLSDYEVLLHLARADHRRLRRVDLAESVLLSPSGITRLLEGLERSELVARVPCPSDARVVWAQLTDAGLARLRQTSKTLTAAIRRVFAAEFSEDELDQLASLLSRLPVQGEAGSCEAA